MSVPNVCARAVRLAADHPERLFCRTLGAGRSSAITYSSLLNGARRYAAIYLDCGVREGDPVLIILRHGPELFPSFLGALFIGALPSFLPFLTPKQQPQLYWAANRALFDRIGARLLVTWAENLISMKKAMPDLSLPVHLAEDTSCHGAVPAIAPRAFTGPAFLQHSSGTTGLKKGVVITHEALSAQVAAYAQAISLAEGDTIATWLPLYHDMGLVACFLMPLMCGVPVVAMDPFEWVLDPVSLLDAMAEYRCTLAWLPNFAFHHIRGPAEGKALRNLGFVRALIDCSEPCKPESLRLFAGRFGNLGLGPDKLQTCYALAENVFAVTQSTLGEPVPVFIANRRALQEELRVLPAQDGEDAMNLLSCGRPIAGVQIRIQDADGGPLPENQVGEIAIAGSSLFAGYHLNPCATGARLADGWYRTRDLGFVLDGELFVTGRLDDVLIVHGVNYYAHDIEFAANTVAGLVPGRCVAIGDYRPHAGTTEVTVLAEAATANAPPPAELKRAIKRAVVSATGLMVEQVGIVPGGWLIKTTSGKLSRGENLKRYREMSSPADEK